MEYFLVVPSTHGIYNKLPVGTDDKAAYDKKMERFKVSATPPIRELFKFSTENGIIWVESNHAKDLVYFDTEDSMVKFQMRYM